MLHHWPVRAFFTWGLVNIAATLATGVAATPVVDHKWRQHRALVRHHGARTSHRQKHIVRHAKGGQAAIVVSSSGVEPQQGHSPPTPSSELFVTKAPHPSAALGNTALALDHPPDRPPTADPPAVALPAAKFALSNATLQLPEREATELTSLFQNLSKLDMSQPVNHSASAPTTALNLTAAGVSATHGNPVAVAGSQIRNATGQREAQAFSTAFFSCTVFLLLLVCIFTVMAFQINTKPSLSRFPGHLQEDGLLTGVGTDAQPWRAQKPRQSYRKSVLAAMGKNKAGGPNTEEPTSTDTTSLHGEREDSSRSESGGDKQ